MQHVGEDRADDEIDLVALEESLDLGHRDVRLEFVVDDDHFRVEPAELAAESLDRQVEAVADLPAEHRGGPREGHDEPDFHLVRGSRAEGCSRPCGQRRREGSNPVSSLYSSARTPLSGLPPVARAA